MAALDSKMVFSLLIDMGSGFYWSSFQLTLSTVKTFDHSLFVMLHSLRPFLQKYCQ